MPAEARWNRLPGVNHSAHLIYLPHPQCEKESACLGVPGFSGFSYKRKRGLRGDSSERLSTVRITPPLRQADRH